jgi:sugar phosphate isomerase/epimerase
MPNPPARSLRIKDRFLNSSPTPVVLSGFADEAANNKTIVEQFAAFAALGLSYYSIRFVDAGLGIKNVMDLSEAEIQHVRQAQNEYGMRVASIGSPIGKMKLLDVEDGTSNRYKPLAEYLKEDVQRACDLALAFDTKLIRGFSFYPPQGEPVERHLAAATDQIAAIVERCAAHDLYFGLEVEANLVGRSGRLLEQIWRKIDHPALMLIFDGANLITQGFSVDETFDEYLQMKAGLGWLHVKDYKPIQAAGERSQFIDEEALSDFRPVDRGSGIYQRVFRDLKDALPQMSALLVKRGLPGLIVELEPHIKGGGQFGGFSGPDGMGVAARALTGLLDEIGIPYGQRGFADTQVPMESS